MDVIIRLKMPPYSPPLRPDDSDKALTQDQVGALYKQAEQKRADAVETVTKPALAALEDMGFKGVAGKYDPVIYASLKPDDVRKVEEIKGVRRIYSSPVFESTNTLDVAEQVVHADVVNGRGMTGSGVNVAEIEVGGQVNTDNPKLSGVTQDTTYSCLADHAAAVAGIIRASFGNGLEDFYGVARDASLWIGGSCGGWDSELEDRSTAAADWGARVFNYSLGHTSCTGMTAFDNYLDGLVANRFRNVAVAAANRGNAGCVTSPALAYNVLAVGASDDKHTAAWSDDSVASYSSAGNPTSTHNDREEPDVMAPGTDLRSTTNSGPQWAGEVGSGTSYATPVVTGIIALLIQRNPTLGIAPPVVRAIIMASAAHNIDGRRAPQRQGRRRAGCRRLGRRRRPAEQHGGRVVVHELQPELREPPGMDVEPRRRQAHAHRRRLGQRPRRRFLSQPARRRRGHAGARPLGRCRRQFGQL